jgi:hypothetical protein
MSWIQIFYVSVQVLPYTGPGVPSLVTPFYISVSTHNRQYLCILYITLPYVYKHTHNAT